MKYHKTLSVSGLIGIIAALAMLPLASPIAAESFPGVNGRLIFSDVNGFDLKSVKTDGSDRKTVSSDAEPQTDAEYSPDGTKIVYRQVVSSVDQVVVANADGSNPHQLTTGSDFSFTPSWSPDGTKIAFIREVSAGDQRIYVMNADGTNQTQLTGNGPYFDPEYSPDGTKIVALLDASDDEVVVMNADGTSIVNLTNNSVNDNKANWSPTGNKIVYSSDVGGLPEIFTMNPDGTGKTQLTSDGKGYRNPVYSPDGAKIAFTDSLAPGPAYTMNADGTNIVAVPNSGWAREVSWQPLTHRPSSSTPNPTVSLSNGKATIDIPSMYTDAYDGIDKATVAVTSMPTSGITSVDSTTGIITYNTKTAAAHPSFWGRLSSAFFPLAYAGGPISDSFTYRVCSLASSGLCSTGTVTVNLLGAPSTGSGRPDNTSAFAWALAAAAGSGIWLGLRRLRSSTN